MTNGEHLWLLLKGVAEGAIPPATAWKAAWNMAAAAPRSADSATTVNPAVQLPPDVVVDLDRSTRCGFPEVVYGPGKSLRQILDVFAAQREAGQSSLVTRCPLEILAALQAELPEAIINQEAGTARQMVSTETCGRVVVVTAGTSDRPVAEEACETLRWMGVETELLADIGVAGPQRLLARLERLRSADAVVVVAGMEGALPSVVAGWVSVPVVGVPTSVGYGVALGGIAPLLSMLNSCAANVTVVNIDAGFKGGFVAGMIARATARGRSPWPSTGTAAGTANESPSTGSPTADTPPAPDSQSAPDSTPDHAV
jgi:NCAIR mutase (PurE)-related protein